MAVSKGVGVGVGVGVAVVVVVGVVVGVGVGVVVGVGVGVGVAVVVVVVVVVAVIMKEPKLHEIRRRMARLTADRRSEILEQREGQSELPQRGVCEVQTGQSLGVRTQAGSKDRLGSKGAVPRNTV